MEDAAPLCGRNGIKDVSKSVYKAIDHAKLVDGGGLAEDPDVESEPIHTAAP